jgi:hypothetical protein
MDEEYVRPSRLILPNASDPVALFDDMEATLNKWKYTGGTGAEIVVRDASIAYNGEASLELQTKAAAPAAGDNVWAQRFTITPNQSRIFKLQCSYMVWANPGGAELFDLEFQYQDARATFGANTFAIRFENGALDWQIYVEPATWVTLTGLFPTLQFDKTIEYWHNLELIGNLETGRYVSARINDVEVDLTDYTADQVPTGNRYAAVKFELTKRFAAALQSQVYLDDITLTTTE